MTAVLGACSHPMAVVDAGMGGGSGATGGGGAGGSAAGGGGGTGAGGGFVAPSCPPYDGGAFVKLGYTNGDTLNDVVESAPGDVWIQGDILLHIQQDGGFDALCLKSPQMPCVSPRSMPGSCGPFLDVACDSMTVNVSGRGLWSSGPNDVWAGNNLGSVMQLTDAGWISWNTADNRSVGVLFGTGASDVWGVDRGTDYTGHFDGTGWSHVNSTCQATALWQSDPAHVWTANSPGISEGAAPCGTNVLMSAPINGLWGSGPGDIWGVGLGGLIVHSDGGSWGTVTSPTMNDLNAIWGCSASNIWAAGAGGTLLHYDGSAWTAVSVPSTADLNGVHGIQNDVWVTGAQGTILHLE
jgi:hypothetical protein